MARQLGLVCLNFLVFIASQSAGENVTCINNRLPGELGTWFLLKGVPGDSFTPASRETASEACHERGFHLWSLQEMLDFTKTYFDYETLPQEADNEDTCIFGLLKNFRMAHSNGTGISYWFGDFIAHKFDLKLLKVESTNPGENNSAICKGSWKVRTGQLPSKLGNYSLAVLTDEDMNRHEVRNTTFENAADACSFLAHRLLSAIDINIAWENKNLRNDLKHLMTPNREYILRGGNAVVTFLPNEPNPVFSSSKENGKYYVLCGNTTLTGYRYCLPLGVVLKWSYDSANLNFTNGHSYCKRNNGTLLSAGAFTSGCTSFPGAPHPAWIDQFEHGKGDEIAYVTGQSSSSTRYLNNSIHVICEIPCPLTAGDQIANISENGHVTCDPGFEYAHAQRPCDIDMRTPSCTPVKCAVPTISNGFSDRTEIQFQETVTFSCNKTLVLVGDAVQICTANGTLSSVPPHCAYSALTGHSYCSQINAVLKWTPSSKTFNFTSGRVICNAHNGTLLSAKAFTKGCTQFPGAKHPAWINQFEQGKEDKVAYVTGPLKSSADHVYESNHVICELPTLTGHQFCPTTKSVLKRTRGKFFNYTTAKAVCHGQEGKLLTPDTYNKGCTSELLHAGYGDGYPVAWLDTASPGKYAFRTRASEAGPMGMAEEVNAQLYVVCEFAVKCVVPPIDNGVTDQRVIKMEESVTYSCTKNLGLVGIAVQTCTFSGTVNGTLSSVPPHCAFVKCAVPPIANGVTDRTVIEMGESVTYSCTKNLVLVGIAVQICTASGAANGTLSSVPPYCAFPASLTSAEFRCPYHPSTILKDFPLQMSFAEATDHCKKFKATIPTKVSCVKDFLAASASNQVVWLAEKTGELQHASDGKTYNLRSDPAPKHNVVCETAPEGSTTCQATRAHIGLYANKATLLQAKEQCRRLGGRLPAGSDEADCLNHAMHLAGDSSVAYKTKPWILDYDEKPLHPNPKYYFTLYDTYKLDLTQSFEFHTVACAFNLREYFCKSSNGKTGVTMVHYPDRISDAKREEFCLKQNARMPDNHSPGENKCIEEFRDLIHTKTGHQEDTLWKQVCVFSPRRTIQKIEQLCGHWKVLVHTKTFEKLLYNESRDACRKNIGFFLPSQALWNSVLIEMKTGDAECRELASTFDKIPLWFTVHGVERKVAHFSSVCVGARFQAGSMSSRGIHKYEGLDYIDEEGHVTCKQGYRKSLQENIPGYPYKGMWQNTAGCYKYVGVLGETLLNKTLLNKVREDGYWYGFKQCKPLKTVDGWERTFKDGHVRCPDGQLWECDPHHDKHCATVQDDQKRWPVCKEDKRINYGRCYDLKKNKIFINDRGGTHYTLERETATFKCMWPAFESCTAPPCAGGRNKNRATVFRHNNEPWEWDNLPKCVQFASQKSGGQHWYYGYYNTTADRAIMACEDVGTELMTLAEVLAIQNFILANNAKLANRYIWVLNPVSNVPIAFNMATNGQKKDTLIAEVMCKSSTNLNEFRTCWTHDDISIITDPKFSSGIDMFLTYSENVAWCDNSPATIIPFPFQHFCLDSLTRWTDIFSTLQKQHWVLDKSSSTNARANDLKIHDRGESFIVTCWTKRPWDDKLVVKHECRNHTLYYLISATGTQYDEAEQKCGNRKMTLPPMAIMDCVWLFTKKLGLPPAWMDIAIGAHERIASDNRPRPTSSAMTAICAQVKEGNSVW